MVRPEQLESVPDDAAPQQVLEVSVRNHAKYGTVADRLIKLQDWVRSQIK